MPPTRRNNKHRGHRISTKHNNNTEISDAQKSLEDWETLSVETLRLKLNNLNVESSGRKNTLVQRIHQHYNPQHINQRQNPIDPNTYQQQSPPPDNNTLAELMDEIRHLRQQVQNI